MALAPYFNKAALALAGVLPDVAFEGLASRLNALCIGVVFDDAAASFEGQTTLELATNLLARLYPVLSFHAQGRAAKKFLPTLEALARRINPAIELRSGRTQPDVTMVIGTTVPSHAQGQVVFVGSDRWLARVGKKPVGSGTSNVPFGAAAGAAIGVANVFRAAFADQLRGSMFDDDVRFSTFLPDGSVDRGPALKRNTELGTASLVGVGAIGSAAVWTLSRIKELRGTLHLIDDEVVELSNAQRYVIVAPEDDGRPKTTLATELFSGSLVAVPHTETYAAYVSQHGNAHFDCVLTALDTAADRIAVQASLPRRILNAWTQTSDLGVSRHTFLGPGACLACLYLPRHAAKHEEELVLEALRLPHGRVREVRELLQCSSPLSHQFLASVAEALGVPNEELEEFEGRSIRQLYTGFICSGRLMQLSADAGERVQVPLAFQSALAGVLLAADFVAEAVGGRPERFQEATRVDLLKPFPMYPSSFEGKHRGGQCLCQDRDFEGAFRGKWMNVREL
jgi:molybdopterin/thiamine biosynthesis adenylyltransferase